MLISVVMLHFMGGMGVTAGAHRLFAHRTYKAKLPLRALLVFLNTIAAQVSVSFGRRPSVINLGLGFQTIGLLGVKA